MLEFGAFQYDDAQRLLFRKGVACALEPKALETLHALITRRGQVVEKAELMRLVWPDTVVEEVGLARNISLVRKALGAEWIETIPKRGYRFVGVAPARVERRRGRWLVGVGLAVLAGVLVYWQFYRSSRFVAGGAGIASLAVVPLESLSPEVAGLAQGLSETLVGELAKLEGLEVVSPGTVRRYQWVGISMAMMGRMLGLEALVEGSVQRDGGGVSVSVRLVDVHSGKLIWAENFDGTAAGRTELARRVAGRIGARLAGVGR